MDSIQYFQVGVAFKNPTVGPLYLWERAAPDMEHKTPSHKKAPTHNEPGLLLEALQQLSR